MLTTLRACNQQAHLRADDTERLSISSFDIGALRWALHNPGATLLLHALTPMDTSRSHKIYEVDAHFARTLGWHDGSEEIFRGRLVGRPLQEYMPSLYRELQCNGLVSLERAPSAKFIQEDDFNLYARVSLTPRGKAVAERCAPEHLEQILDLGRAEITCNVMDTVISALREPTRRSSRHAFILRLVASHEPEGITRAEIRNRANAEGTLGYLCSTRTKEHLDDMRGLLTERHADEENGARRPLMLLSPLGREVWRNLQSA